MEEAQTVVALSGMALVLLGVFQYLKTYIGSADTKYQLMVQKWEKEHYERAAAEQEKALWKMRAYRCRRVNLQLRRKLQLCQDAVVQDKIGGKPQI